MQDGLGSSDVYIKSACQRAPDLAQSMSGSKRPRFNPKRRLQLQREDAAQRCLQRQDIRLERLQLSIGIRSPQVRYTSPPHKETL